MLISSLAPGVFAAPPEGPLVAVDDDRGTRLRVGAKVVSGTVRSEMAGFVALTLPLDRIATPRQVAQQPPAEDEQEAEPRPAESPPAPERQAPAPERQPPPREEEPPPPIHPATFLALARQSVRQALVVAGLPRDRRKLDSLASRARASAALPQLRLRVARSDDEALRLTPTSEDPYRYSLAGGTDLLLEASATWRLDRLLFADEEVALMRLRIERDKAEAAVTARTLQKLFAWSRAFGESRDPALDVEARAEAALAAWEAHAELDVLTGGWFSERLNELWPDDGFGRDDELDLRSHARRNQEQSPGPSKAR